MSYARLAFVVGFVICGVCALAVPAVSHAEPKSLAQLVRDAHARFKSNRSGAPADYIPQLASVPPELFAVAIVTTQGETYVAGDSDYTFSIQSVSKPFTAALVMQEQGDAAILEKIGVEPTGLAFNSIAATQQLPSVTGNPLVNAGAIATVSLIQAENAEQRFEKISAFFARLSASQLHVLEPVYASEANHNQRNRALAYILDVAKPKRIYADPLEAVAVYTRQCALGVNVKQLAIMGATLANAGDNPITKQHVLERRYVSKVLALMLMAGFYNDSGRWAFTTGLPAKTGVGGGIVAVVPGRFAIAAFSPRIDPATGSSVRAALAIRYIAEQLDLNIFDSQLR
ncbi:MAG: hypothetical protein RL701_7478 [Pseudomonadota bacterium]|jgi:glutaminase